MRLISEPLSRENVSEDSGDGKLVSPISVDTIEYGNAHSQSTSEDNEVTLLGMDPVVPTPYPQHEVVWGMTIEAIVFGQCDIGEVIVIYIAPGGCVLGRSSFSNNRQRQDTFCSKDHALLSISPAGTLLLRDLNSKNGTFLNGSRVVQSAVSQGDEICLGRTTLRLLAIHREPVARLQFANREGGK